MLGENPALFPGGWFVESLFIQTLILHVIHTHKILVLQCRASGPHMLISVLVVTVRALRTVSPLADVLGLVPLPVLYWPLLAGILMCCLALEQWVKTGFCRRFGHWRSGRLRNRRRDAVAGIRWPRTSSL